MIEQRSETLMGFILISAQFSPLYHQNLFYIATILFSGNKSMILFLLQTVVPTQPKWDPLKVPLDSYEMATLPSEVQMAIGMVFAQFNMQTYLA